MDAKLRDLARKFPQKVRSSLYLRAELIMTESKRDFCPVKDGPLRASGHVVMDDTAIRIFLGYGGPAGIGNVGGTNAKEVGYAIIQHEELSFEHTVGQAEYLKIPFLAAAATLVKDLAGDVRL